MDTVVRIFDVDSNYIKLEVSGEAGTEIKIINKLNTTCSRNESKIRLSYNYRGEEINDDFDNQQVIKPSGSITEKIDKINLYLQSNQKIKVGLTTEADIIDAKGSEYVGVKDIEFNTRPNGRYSFVIYGKAKGNGSDGSFLKIEVPEGAKLNARVTANKEKISEFFSYFINEAKPETKEKLFTIDQKSLLFSITGSLIGGPDDGVVKLKANGSLTFLPGCGVTAYEF